MLKLLKQDSPLISHAVGAHSFSEWYEEQNLLLYLNISFSIKPKYLKIYQVNSWMIEQTTAYTLN